MLFIVTLSSSLYFENIVSYILDIEYNNTCIISMSTVLICFSVSDFNELCGSNWYSINIILLIDVKSTFLISSFCHPRRKPVCRKLS